MLSIEQVAQVAHELNRAYCIAIGDNSQPSWEEAPEWQKSSAMNGVKMHLANPDATPEDSHKSWLAQKSEEGWCYGPVKNLETKEHPCFVPYNELPEGQRAKDYIFRQSIHSLSKFVRKEGTRGQIVMAVDFNPGGNEAVKAIKLGCADLFDLIGKYENEHAEKVISEASLPDGDKPSSIRRLASIAKTNLETAQMYAVKAVTR